MKFGVKWRESTGRMLSPCRANKRITMVMRREVCGSVQKSSHSSIVEEWVGGGHQIRQLWYLYAFFCFSHLKTNHWVWLFCSLIVCFPEQFPPLHWRTFWGIRFLGGLWNGVFIWQPRQVVVMSRCDLATHATNCEALLWPGNQSRWPDVTWQPAGPIALSCC